MATTICVLITIIIMLWRIFNGVYTVGGEIFLPLMPMFVRFLWSYYKAERKATEQYIRENPEEFED